MVAGKKTKKSLESISSRIQLIMKVESMCWNTFPMMAQTGVRHHRGNNIELSSVCGKYYRVCMLAIIDSGDSDNIRNLPEQTGEK
ncbi:unnamed protein product [Nyctereutes procyonoides]|uniref:(raccoon dog) hypothetical protein n=1 Tax=Nyctereutes procyonoides TaxID=34880 RepID=A0A811ZQQ1_NYCPR|nr:unnamed protein product [Nyctereutes procyonoides]